MHFTSAGLPDTNEPVVIITNCSGVTRLLSIVDVLTPGNLYYWRY